MKSGLTKNKIEVTRTRSFPFLLKRFWPIGFLVTKSLYEKSILQFCKLQLPQNMVRVKFSIVIVYIRWLSTSAELLSEKLFKVW